MLKEWVCTDERALLEAKNIISIGEILRGFNLLICNYEFKLDTQSYICRFF